MPSYEEKYEFMKILQVNKLYFPDVGGIEKTVQQLSEGLAEKAKCKVLVCRRKGKAVTERVNNIEVIRAHTYGTLFSMPISVDFILKFRKLSKDADIIHFHMPFPLGDLACLLSGYKGKVVIWWHSDIIRQEKIMLFYKPLMNWMLKRADTIIVATRGNIIGSKYLKTFQKKCVIIPFALDKFTQKKADEYAEISNKGLAQSGHNEEVNFLFVGRLVYYKGCEYLIKAFKDTHDAKLTIVGDGPLKSYLLNLACELGLESRIDFTGYVSDEEIIKYYEKCDVFVLPSVYKSEAFGLVQIEAMSFGKPVINTDLETGVPYVSINNQTGITVSAKNIKELNKAINYMIDNKEKRDLMGNMARQRVNKYYRYQQMVDSVYELYQKLLNN